VHPIIEPLMRQHFGRHGPSRVLLVRAHWNRRDVAPSSVNRELLWPLLPAIAINTELRPQRRPLARAQRRALTREQYKALRQEAKQRKIIDASPALWRRRVCAAGYLMLVAALAAAGSEATAGKRKRAKAVAMELLHTTKWLYGKPLHKPVISLVKAVTGEDLGGSIVKIWAKQLTGKARKTAKKPAAV
jgi:hypothetical protein